MSDARQIDPYSQQLGMLQAELRAVGTNVEATRQDQRVLDGKVETMVGQIAGLQHLHDLLIGDEHDPGLKQKVAELTQALDRGRVAWRLLVWLAGLLTGVASLGYAFGTLVHWGHR